jgi:IclR family pca regulon transcriptional regulator
MPRVRRSAEDPYAAEAGDPEFVAALARGLRVVLAFGPDRRQATLADLAKAVDLPRATVRRTLTTLVRMGFVEAEGRLFRPTPRVLLLARAYLAADAVPIVAQPIVERVCAEIGEACSCAVLDGTEVVFVARASPARILSVGLEVGYRLPAVCTSVGRALLGGRDEAAIDAFLAGVEPPRLTPRTLVRREDIRAAVLRDRAQGWSLVDQEAEIGFRSIAVPVRRRDGRVACALNVGAHADRASPERMTGEFLPRLRAAAAEMERLLV